jgi:predicted nucleotidyltransferase
MTKIKKPEEVFAEIEKDFKAIFNDAIISIILYGSGAGSDFNPHTSDLNFLIILSEEAIDHLDKAIETVSRWRKKNVATPLFMTKSYIESSLDSYPLEFLNMKKNYILVYGEDILKDISLQPHHLRLQCEREIKGKLLLLREGFLETEGKQKRIKELIKASITAFISIFNGLLYLKGIEILPTRREIIQSVAKEIPIDQEIFMKCLDIKQDTQEFSSSEIKNLFKAYLVEVRKLWEVVDKMEM